MGQGEQAYKHFLSGHYKAVKRKSHSNTSMWIMVSYAQKNQLSVQIK